MIIEIIRNLLEAKKRELIVGRDLDVMLCVISDAEHIHERTEFKISQVDIAAKLGINKSGVNRSIKCLIFAGFLDQQKAFGRKKKYNLGVLFIDPEKQVKVTTQEKEQILIKMKVIHEEKKPKQVKVKVIHTEKKPKQVTHPTIIYEERKPKQVLVKVTRTKKEPK